MAGEEFTPEQENAVLDILAELYARGRFVTYADLATAVRFTGSRRAFVSALIACRRICHDHSSRIVTRNGTHGALAHTRVGTEAGTFDPADHLRLDEQAIARSRRVPGDLIETDPGVLRAWIRPARG